MWFFAVEKGRTIAAAAAAETIIREKECHREGEVRKGLILLLSGGEIVPAAAAAAAVVEAMNTICTSSLYGY